MLVKDLAPSGGKPEAQQVFIEGERAYYDGPVSPRVAVLDFDPDTGALLPGVSCQRPKKTRGVYRYGPRSAPSGDAFETPEFIAASVFATVHETMAKFEEPDILGRRIVWAFPGPQLLVVPRAGEWENAFYERDSRSLQFFYFAHRGDETPRRVHTALSEDIVAHETTHAILDGIAPDLYGALAPESLALHEAIADLGALSIALSTRLLQQRFLESTQGELARWSDFQGLAKAFAEGTARGSVFLRDLGNKLTMDHVGKADPHEMSLVLTGALYALWAFLYESFSAELADEDPHLARKTVGGKALWRTREIYERMAFRALDYLPPGEVSFADYARAVLAADRAGNPEFEQPRAFLRRQFVERGIVADEGALEVPIDLDVAAVAKAGPETLLESDYAAYAFANENRALLKIPAGVPFKVAPRLATEKLYYHRLGARQDAVREILFKVSWTEDEPQNLRGLPPVRHVVAGTTLAIDRDTAKVRVLLTTSKDEAQRERRDRFLQRLVASKRLALGADALDLSGLPRQDVIRADVVDGAMRVRNTANLLHVCGDAADE